MPDEWTREELVVRWRAFIELNGADELSRVLALYPDQRSVFFEYGAIERHDEALADQLLSRPQTSLYASELALNEVIEKDYRRPRGAVKIHVRARGLPAGKSQGRLEVRELRAKHLGRLVSVEGLVRRRSDVRPMVLEAMYQCERCHNVVMEHQSDFDLKEPVECYKDQGGCGRTSASTRWKLLEERSTVMDTQRFVIQELPERVKDGEQPEKLVCWLFDDLAGAVKPGQRVTANGLVRAKTPDRKRAGRGILEVHLEVLSIDSDEKTGDLELGMEDLQLIHDEAAKGDVLARIARSIAPALYGLEIEKTAIALQMFGGTRKPMPDGTFLRGDIHILLLGDPSTGKSQLLSAIKTVHYRVVSATGRGASGAGLTAAVCKDEVTGEYGLEPGALPMANGGMLCCDEIDKMDEEDRARMHPAMEQGVVEINKAGINATMAAQAAILAAANPKHGSWEQNRAMVDQVDLPPALISRFDAIFVFKDLPDGGDRDRRLARHILQAHYVGSLAHRDDDLAAAGALEFTPPLRPEFIRKYVFFARTRHRAPVMTPDTIARLERHFLDLRKEMAGSEEHVAKITPRQLEGLVRFAEASARARLSDRVEEEDVAVAMRVFDAWVTRLSESGRSWDLNVMYGALPTSVRDDMAKLKDLIRVCDRGAGATKAEVLERAERDLGMKPDRVRYLVEKLHTEGGIFERDEDHWRAA